MSRLVFALLLASMPAWASPPELGVFPDKAKPGDAVLVTVAGAREECPSGKIGERSFQFFSVGKGCRAIVGLPVEEKPGVLDIRVGELAAKLEVVPARFNERELTVAARYVEPPAKVRKRMDADRKAFARAFAQEFGKRAAFERNFDWPVRSEITAPFGDLRLFNGKKQSQHYGMDLDGRIGDPVVAANDGVVVMARDNYAAGKTVVVHHGGDLYTTYFHLSAIEVKRGARVKRGQQIGRIGRTGRVTGPHLHWGVKVGGLYVDPASLLGLDFEAR